MVIEKILQNTTWIFDMTPGGVMTSQDISGIVPIVTQAGG